MWSRYIRGGFIQQLQGTSYAGGGIGHAGEVHTEATHGEGVDMGMAVATLSAEVTRSFKRRQDTA